MDDVGTVLAAEPDVASSPFSIEAAVLPETLCWLAVMAGRAEQARRAAEE